MIRPRAGGFCYTQVEMAVMRHDAKLAVEHGADGLVFGILTPDGEIDAERCKRIIELARDRQTVFHRAFDVTPDPLKALDQLVDLGFTRVLTSGQEKSAPEGIETIRKLIVHADDRIEILPGSGLRPTESKSCRAAGFGRITSGRSWSEQRQRRFISRRSVKSSIHRCSIGRT